MQNVLKNDAGVTLLGFMVTVFLLVFLVGLSMNTGLWQQAKEVANSVNFARIEEEIELEIIGLEMDYFLDYETNSIHFRVPLEYIKNELEQGIVTATGAQLTSDKTGNLIYTNKLGEVMYASLDDTGRITIKGETKSNEAREELLTSIME